MAGRLQGDGHTGLTRRSVCVVVAQTLLALVLLVDAASVSAQPASAAGFGTPTETPAATAKSSAARAPLLALTEAGKRLVAVGQRGRIVFSDDAGRTWAQAKVPVEVDLVAVNFATPTHGFAVGHRGVMLESADAGSTWTRRFANQQLSESAVRFYQGLNAPAGSAVSRALASTSRAIKESSVPSLLDVWFESASVGTIVGTFNTIFRTEDGGKTWTPWMDRTDNPEELHFYTVRGGPSGMYLAGEKGGVWRLDAAAGKWVAVSTGYAGTLFGLLTDGAKVLAYGMRGSVFVSDDAGGHWQAVAMPRKAGFAAGVRLRSGDILLADQGGELMRSTDAGHSFAAVETKGRTLSFSLMQGSDGQLLSVGPAGVAAIVLPAQQ